MSNTHVRLGLADAFVAVSISDAHWPWIMGCIVLLIVLLALWSSR